MLTTEKLTATQIVEKYEGILTTEQVRLLKLHERNVRRGLMLTPSDKDPWIPEGVMLNSTHALEQVLLNIATEKVEQLLDRSPAEHSSQRIYLGKDSLQKWNEFWENEFKKHSSK